MKIGLAHKRFELRGGTERILYRTAEGLRDRGHEVHLFCGEFVIEPPTGTFAHRVPSLRWPRTARLLTFAYLAPAFIARHACDVVVSFDRMVAQDIFRSGGGPHRTFLEKMRRAENFPRKIWYGLAPYHRVLLAVERRQMGDGGSKKIIAVCDQIGREIADAYHIPNGKVVVLHNGVDLERFHPRRRENEGRKLRESLKIPPDARVVVFVGTGFRRKGLDRLLQLWDSAGFEGIYLLVVGNDSRLSYYRNRWARKEIIFAGAQPLVENYYAAADLLVLPSIQEAFGNVALEALASGLPVVASAGVGALDQASDDLRQGMLSDVENSEELKSKILSLLARERWTELSRSARRTAERYSWDNYFSELERIMKEVAAERARRAS
ncbi:MAG TPA: glycosyltransferase family 4 protein [Candidatus Binatia bacterium]|nr:glycosyltransferase family 4 protein [Candidatus Binatia bacterium]